MFQKRYCPVVDFPQLTEYKKEKKNTLNCYRLQQVAVTQAFGINSVLCERSPGN